MKEINLKLKELLDLRHFPLENVAYPHKKRDYFIAVFTFFCVAICLMSDANASIEKQNALGVSGWVFLIGLLLGENREVRMQVVIAVIFVTSLLTINFKIPELPSAPLLLRICPNLLPLVSTNSSAF